MTRRPVCTVLFVALLSAGSGCDSGSFVLGDSAVPDGGGAGDLLMSIDYRGLEGGMFPIIDARGESKGAPDMKSPVDLKSPLDQAGKVDSFVWPDIWPPDIGSGGGVSRGFYKYTAVPVYGLVNPTAAAYHPGGTYALVLDAGDKVYRYTTKGGAIAQAATAGSGVTWRAAAFTSSGDKAVLLGNHGSLNQGRVYIWDHASAKLTELTTARLAGGTYEALARAAGGATFKLLGSKKSSGAGYLAYLWDLDPAKGTSNVKATFTSAGCQDLAWATDAYGKPAVAVVCGVNGATLGHLDFGGTWNAHTQNAGNTSSVSGRPQADYALAVCWSCGGKVYRFEKGAWSTPYASPKLTGASKVFFSGDGKRALLLGGYGTGGVGLAHEYRHNLMTQNDFTDVSIPNFDQAPYNAQSGVQLNHAAWRPGCDGGLIVGGANSYSLKKGYVIRFQVTNGVACP